MARISNIQRYSIHDGPGIRTTVFFKGCPLKCQWCHNPETIDPKPQLMVDLERCTGCGLCVEVCPVKAIKIRDGIAITDFSVCNLCGKCVQACPYELRELCGTEMSVEDVMREVEKDAIFYEESGGGVTFSGGEPLTQHKFLVKVLEACREKGISTAVDTSGYANWNVFEEILPLTDIFLYDVKHLDDEEHMRLTGVSNRQILENLGKLCVKHSGVHIRVPVIPGLNDFPEYWERLAEYLAKLKFIEVDLLPFHNIARKKYVKLRMDYHMADARSVAPDRMKTVAAYFEKKGIKVSIGG